MARAHYNTFTVAFLTTFQIITFDDWAFVMYDAARHDAGVSIVYFLIWLVLGALILLNLLLVIILNAFVEESAAAKEERALADNETNTNERAAFEMEINFANPVQDAVDDDSVFDTQDAARAQKVDVSMHSFGCLPAGNPLRDFAVHLTSHVAFDPCNLSVVFLNCITMALDTPFLDSSIVVDERNDARMLQILHFIDFAFTIVFTVEAVFRSLAWGFVLGPTCYLSYNWNRLDFTIVVVSWVDVIVSSSNLGALKSLRLLRAFRALRMLNKVEGLQHLVVSLIQSMTALVHVIGVTFLVWSIFAIFGVHQFKGQFYRCDDSEVYGRLECIGSFVDDHGEIKADSWRNAQVHFDNFGQAMALLYEASVDSWISSCWRAMDIAGVDRQPVRENSPQQAAFFIIFIVVSNFFCLVRQRFFSVCLPLSFFVKFSRRLHW